MTSCADDNDCSLEKYWETFLLTGAVTAPEIWDGDIPESWGGPTFVVGCGFSGMEILGKLLPMHSQISSIGQARSLWISAFPQMDVWSIQAFGRSGRLRLDNSALNDHQLEANRLRRLFYAQQVRSGRPVIVELQPENAFRIGLLSAIFPRARFIHVIRNGHQVARAIARFSQEAWYGVVGAYKWTQVLSVAREQNIISDAEESQPSFESMLSKGLLEWTTCVDVARRDAQQYLNPTRYFELRYEDLVKQPALVFSKLEDFLDLAHDHHAASNLPDTIPSDVHDRLDIGLLDGCTRTHLLLGELGYSK
eukprot:211461_1